MPLRTVILETPPWPRLVPDGIFDAYGWCESTTLRWLHPTPGFDRTRPLTLDNPPGLLFVFEKPCAFLPREHASVHVPSLEPAWALAPYGIDDATDEFWARRERPSEWLSMYADSVVALFWGLHDWAHFHNHGPFEERAWTELQCDVSALGWLWLNRAAVEIDERAWRSLAEDASTLTASRFRDEGKAFPDEVGRADAVIEMAERIALQGLGGGTRP